MVQGSTHSISLGMAPPIADSPLLLAALDASEQHVLITDRKGRIIFANLSLAERHGRVRNELIGESVEQIMRTDNHSPSQREKMREAMRENRQIRVVVQGVHSSGRPMWLSLNITPILDSDGSAGHFVGTVVTHGGARARAVDLAEDAVREGADEAGGERAAARTGRGVGERADRGEGPHAIRREGPAEMSTRSTWDRSIVVCPFAICRPSSFRSRTPP